MLTKEEIDYINTFIRREQTNWTGEEPFIKYMNKPPIVRNEKNMAYKYQCPICKYVNYTGYMCEHGEKSCSIVILSVKDIQQEQTKMTRQDAILKMPMGYENLPAALETLGLIKFEEEKKDNSIANQIGLTFSHARHWNLHDHTLTDIGVAFISDLKSAGYKIVKA